MKKPKTYQQYKDEAKDRHDSIMQKYGAPAGAQPPRDISFIPASSDRHYRKYAFTLKKRLQGWEASGRKYPTAGAK